MNIFNKNILILTLTALVLWSSLAYGKGDFLPKSFSAQFEQEYISTLKGKVKKGSGTIDYQYPGLIRFKTTLPSEILFVSNGKKSWYYRAPFIDGEEGEVTETNAKDGSSIFTRFFDSLKNGLSDNSLYKVSIKGSICTIFFLEKAITETGIKEATIKFQKSVQDFSSIQSIEMIFPDLKKSTIKLKNININSSFEAKHFEFAPPVKPKKV